MQRHETGNNTRNETKANRQEARQKNKSKHGTKKRYKNNDTRNEARHEARRTRQEERDNAKIEVERSTQEKKTKRNLLGTEVGVGVDLIAKVQDAIQVARHARQPVPQAHLLGKGEAVAAHAKTAGAGASQDKQERASDEKWKALQ